MIKSLKELITYEPLIELRPINLYFVSRYRQAVRNGAIFPPVLIEAKTNRIVSGNHRVAAYLAEYGEDHEIEVVERTFKDKADLIRTFAVENNSHGNPLSGISQKAITQKLLEYGNSPETIAKALNIPVKKVQSIGGLHFVVVGKNNKKECKPMKHGLEHKAGSVIKEKVYNEHRKHDRGVTAKTMAEQLMRWIDNGWVDMEDDNTHASLKALYLALENMFTEVA